jgi:hypothetical protein
MRPSGTSAEESDSLTGIFKRVGGTLHREGRFIFTWLAKVGAMNFSRGRVKNDADKHEGFRPYLTLRKISTVRVRADLA